MRILADEGFSFLAIEALRAAGHDVIWSRDVDPGAADQQVLDVAQNQKRVVLTDDRDFGELVFRCGRNAEQGIIYCRIGELGPQAAIRRVVEAIASIENCSRKFFVVTATAMRMRLLRQQN